jgi:SAM-dependent methyltransferase
VTRHDWDAVYRSADLPWDTGSPDPHLVEFIRSHGPVSGKALEVGCGTGTNCLWLGNRGYEVLGIDISPTAIRQAESKAAGVARVRFACLDFLKDEVPDGPFDFVFDRGCFHVFDDAGDRALFAERVARALAPGGRWVSIVGSTEGPPRDHGPPRRTARDLTNAIEPVLELVELRGTEFHANVASTARAWFCVARPREAPAQPSTRR